MKDYLRFLSKNRLYLIIEVIGISIAFAFSIPLLSFWGDKWFIDYSPGYKKIYAICPIGDFETTIGLGPKISESIPEIEQYAQIYTFDDNVVQFEGSSLQASGLAVNTGFYDLFNIALIEGSPSSKADRRSILISNSFASKIASDPIGKTILFSGEEYRVVGIFDDIHNSLIPPTDIIFNINSPLLDEHWKMPAEYWDNIYTLIKVRQGVKTKELFKKCILTCKEYYSTYYSQHPENQKNIKLIRYDRISSNISNDRLTQTWGVSLWAVELFGAFLLVFAIINYVNLTVALSLKRGKEWSMKKLLGLSHIKTFESSFFETFFVTLSCFLIGYSLSHIIVPIFNDFFLATHSYIELNSSITLRKALLYVVFIVVLSLIATIIPARIACKYSPIDVVSGRYRKMVKSGTSNFLIGVQCFLTIILLSVSTLFYAQYRKMINRPRGQIADNLFIISGNYSNDALTMAANALRALPFVRQVGKSNDCPGDGRFSRVTVKSSDGTITPLYILRCDSDAFRAFGFITRNHMTASEGLWLSNSAIEELTLHGEDSDYGIIDERSINVAGIISDFVMDIESNVNSGVEITESGDFNRLIINTIGHNIDYPEKILKTFEEAILQTHSLYIPPTDSGYLEYYYQKSIRPTKSILYMLAVYTFFSLLLGILGLVAMSINYVSLHQKDIAIRKVYGSSTNEEIGRNIAIYLKTTLLASSLGIMVSVIINRTIIQSYSYRLTSTIWIYLLVVAFVIGVTTISVYAQISKVVSKNPILFLRSE